jgi:hypothetical protein
MKTSVILATSFFILSGPSPVGNIKAKGKQKNCQEILCIYC